MAEFGIVTAKGSKRVADLAEELDTLPEAARPPRRALFDQLAETQTRIDRLTDEIGEVHRQN
jgi:transposase